VAELHTTKRVRELANIVREEVDKQGADLRSGDHVERMIAERVQTVARQLGVTPRTVLDRYLTEDRARAWAVGIAAELRDAELVAYDAAPVVIDQRDGLLVLAAFGVCGTLAVNNLDRWEQCDPMIVLKDAADSTVEFAINLYEAGDEPALIGGMGIVVGRKVLSMTMDALRHGWWQCTCGQPHRPDGGCGLQDRFEQDLAALGGWINRDETA